MRKYLFIAFIILFSFQIKAQEIITNRLCDSSITIRQGLSRGSGSYYYVGWQRASWKFITEKLNNRFYQSGNEFKIYKKHHKIGVILIISAIVAAAGTTWYLSASNNYNHYPNLNGIVALPIASFSLVEFFRSNKHFSKSVELYNKEMCNRYNK
ncbi:MAG TPA: hypothetical protein VF411_06285 [Bacteroidia bacterium]